MQMPAGAVAFTVPTALFVLLLGIWAPAAAQNWIAVLKDTPAEQLTEDDARLLGEAARTVLNDPHDNASGSWINPATRNRGQITAAKSFRWREHPCRTLRLDYELGRHKGSTPISLCQVEGKWRAISASEARDATSP